MSIHLLNTGSYIYIWIKNQHWGCSLSILNLPKTKLRKMCINIFWTLKTIYKTGLIISTRLLKLNQAMCLLLHFDDQTVLILNFTRFFYGTFDQALSFVVAGNETEFCSSGRGWVRNRKKVQQARCLLLHFDDPTGLILNYEEFLWKKRDQALPFVVALWWSSNFAG